MGKTQSKQKTTTATKTPAPSANQDGESAKKSEPKDLIISFNEDFTQVDVKKEKRALPSSKRRMSRVEKLKSRKLPHTLKIQIIDEDEEIEGEGDGSSMYKSSDHHMTHMERIKRRKMPAGKRIFGEHYQE